MVDTITADTTEDIADLPDSAALFVPEGNERTAAVAVQSPSRALSGRYYMIVGCFAVPNNAEKYMDKIRDMGYMPELLQGPNNLQMVSAKFYGNYSEGIAELDRFRQNVTPHAWVYRQR